MANAISRNRHFSSAMASATLKASAASGGASVVAYLDRGLDDLDSWTGAELAAGISRAIKTPGLHVLEVLVAFTSTSPQTCSISVDLVGSDGTAQNRRLSLSGAREDLRRVCFYVPVI